MTAPFQRFFFFFFYKSNIASNYCIGVIGKYLKLEGHLNNGTVKSLIK